MNIPDEVPKLNLWPFIVVDALLLAVASFIGLRAPGPLSSAQLLVVGLLIFLGAILAVIPFLLNFTRRQENALAERQREIAALAQSTAASAEQLSIAAASLHTIAETASKSAKHAEQLPQKLQEKIHEFKEQLNEVSMSENEALSQEVNTLRAAETERIETILTTVRKLSSEIARLEAASRKNVTELSDSLSRFTTSAEQAAAEATTAIASLRAGAEKSLAAAHTSALGAIEETLSHALSEIDTKVANLSGHLTAKIDHAAEVFDQKIAALKSATVQIEALRSETASVRAPRRSAQPKSPAEDVPATTVVPSSDSTPAEAPANSTPAPQVSDAPREATESPREPQEPSPARKRQPKPRDPADHELTLGLDLPEIAIQDRSQPIVSPSADGQTRLLVTAYIGIGNKLFLRGEGPGLSWETGVPLQFVSIGKWRWESAEASAPIRGKLYKNDEVECAALGELSFEPGHQCEVTATF